MLLLTLLVRFPPSSSVGITRCNAVATTQQTNYYLWQFLASEVLLFGRRISEVADIWILEQQLHWTGRITIQHSCELCYFDISGSQGRVAGCLFPFWKRFYMSTCLVAWSMFTFSVAWLLFLGFL